MSTATASRSTSRRAIKPGKTPPQHAYSLATTAPSTAGPRFYVGGTIYTDWAAVPDTYKIMGSQTPDPRRSTASVFKFVW